MIAASLEPAALESLVALRRDLHAHPETAFEEHRTASRVAAELRKLELETHEGIAETGVVAVLRAGKSERIIGLRADMDALPMDEANTFDHRSVHAGKFHGCGHDGHTVMLLAAAKLLAAAPRFDGTVVFIFQPAEEGEGGGRRMVEEGLFKRFPVDAVYGMHNIPGIPAGHLGVKAGPMMASFDKISITVTGVGGHAAFPHRAKDVIVAASALVQALQTVTSREIDPLESGVLSITAFQSGTTHNVLPESAQLMGTARAFSPVVRDLIEAGVRRICAGIAQTHGVAIELDYARCYPPTINTEREAGVASAAALRAAGPSRVLMQPSPLMAAEDFAFMLEARPGAYVWIGNGVGSEGGCMVHNPHYDFNDAIIPDGAAFWVSLVETALPLSTA
jgi:amidohydrolase